MENEQKHKRRLLKKIVLWGIVLGVVALISWWLYASVFIGRLAGVYVTPGNLFLGRITWFPHPVLHDPWIVVFDDAQSQNTETADGGVAGSAQQPRVIPWASAVPFVPKGKRISVPSASILQWAYLDKTDSFRQFIERGGLAAQQSAGGLGGGLGGGLQQQPPLQGSLPQQPLGTPSPENPPTQQRF
jgi:hypothetical protein